MDSSENSAAKSHEPSHAHTAQLTLVANSVATAPALRTANLGAFLVEAGEQIHHLRAQPTTNEEFVQQAYNLIAAFLVRETGCGCLEDAMGLLYHRMWGGAAELRLLADLYYRLRVRSLEKDSNSSDVKPCLTREGFLAELEQLLRWYGRRKVSLSVLEEEHSRVPEQDALFGVRIFDDKVKHGQRGFEVSCGLRLSGHAGEQLWLKVQFKEGNRFLRGRHAWLDQSGLKFCTRSNEGRVSAVLPVNVDYHRVVVDEALLFVPYVALGLQPGKQTVEVLLALTSEHGDELLTQTRVHTFIVPPSYQVRDVGLYSPHLLGMWEQDVGRGDGLSNWQALVSGTTLAIRGDLRLYDREDETLQLECRLLHDDETEVPLADCYREQLRRTLNPGRPMRCYQNLFFQLPLLALDLEPGYHELLVEVVLSTASGRVIFGTRESVQVEGVQLSAEDPLVDFVN